MSSSEEEEAAPAKRDAEEEDDSEEEEKVKPKAKKAKKQKEAKEATKDFESGVEIGGTRRISVRTFKGKTLIDIREYYTDSSGTAKPGKKGISLSPEQWNGLKAIVDDVDEAIANI
ncbi:activated RNA polymerase II transcriptional coactivator p15-like protein [Tribonema minus]|uniref:Activated RNA polymerase II transcriptional coactivator p15-like protein n=1 Tax=Tribonema minus TaxID=303371 RepID=A0A835YR41_9STRA|nr:activated RNA polymerase II transcriptional coactivator p15-like protein [Tribonema minus]